MMKKHSTHLCLVHFISLFSIVVCPFEKSVAQCFIQGTKGYTVMNSTEPVQDLVVADFNGDSISDLAVSYYDLPVTLYLNDGKGNFLPDTSTHFNYGDVIDADLNGDGKPDLIVRSNPDLAEAYINQGNAKFKLDSFKNIPVASKYADVNNDNKDDALKFQSQSSFSVSINSGNDSFATARKYVLPFLINKKFQVSQKHPKPFCYALADINSDKSKDILFCTEINDSGFIKVYENNGKGHFFPSKSIYLPFIPLDIDVADMNGDSITDILVADKKDSLHILLQDSTSNFHQSSSVSAIKFRYFYKIATRDLNKDGSNDIVAMLDNGDLQLYFGDGHGKIDSSKHYIVRSATFDGRFTLKPKDLNGDGSPDLALLNSDNRLSFMFNDGKGNFGHPFMYDTDSTACCNGGYEHISTGDITGQKTADVILSNNSLYSTSFKIISFTENQNFREDSTNLNENKYHGHVDFENLNNDSLTDIVYVGYFPYKIYFQINQGNFHFITSDSIPAAFGSLYAFGDLNNDGSADLVLINSDTFFIYLNNGNGKFTRLKSAIRFNPAPSVAIADINKDGYMDIILGNNPNIPLTFYMNNGSDSFSTSNVITPRDLNPVVMASSDLNGDGHPDLVTEGNNNFYIDVLLNDGSGNFPAETHYVAGNPIKNIHVADMNGDGKPDLLIVSGNPAYGEILYNNGDGSFGNPLSFGTQFNCGDMAAVDLNGDHKNDLLLTDIESNSMESFINCDSGTFTSVPNHLQLFNNVLSVFPNPSTGSFTVSLKAEGLNQAKSWLSVFNIYGQKIYQQKLIVNQNSITQNVIPHGWANGIYFVKIESGNTSWESKFIKQ